MLKYIFRVFFVLIVISLAYSSLKAQEARRLSLSVFGGVAFYPKSNINTAGLPTRVLGGFKPSPLLGLGAYFQLTKRFQLGENYTYLLNAKSGSRSLSNHSFRTTFKYCILKDKKINPYLLASVNLNLISLARKANSYTYVPDAGSTSNIIGNGIQLDSINYNEKQLKLSNMPTMGVSFGAGVEVKLTKKINFFAEYSIHENSGKNNALIEKYYFYNASNFVYHSVSAGVNVKLFKPQKQLLATLDRDDWKNSRSIDVKGTIIYKNPAKPYKKILPVEETDTAQIVLQNTPTDEKALIFFAKGIEPGDYKFMLPKKYRKIIRADLQILNYNKIDIADDELELEMVEDEISENILSRDANFAVLLREGFQHEIELSTTAENIMGVFVPSDTNCRVRIILKNQFDSVIAYIDTLKDNKFNFVDIEPGNYKISFQRMNKECTQTIFNYSFAGAKPFVRKQSNKNEPQDTVQSYTINGKVSTSATKLEAPKGTVSKLIDPSGRVVSQTILGGSKTDFNYRNLTSPNYAAVFEDPTNKASMSYKVKDKTSKVIRQVTMSTLKKPTIGHIVVKGTVELPNATQAKLVTAMLIDSSGKVLQKLPINSDGSFSFENLAKNKYKVAYESTDPLVRGTLNYNTIDKSLKISKIVLPTLTASIEATDTIHFHKKTIEPAIPIKDTAAIAIVTPVTKADTSTVVPTTITPAKDTTAAVPIKIEPIKDTTVLVKNVPTKKTKEIPIKYPFIQFKPGTTYNDLGYEVKPEGYGIQVASFFINSNLEKFCQRLRTKGEKSIFIQVILKDKNNPEAGTIYRVLLGAEENKEKMAKKIAGYMDKGYDPVLRKHL